MELREPKDKLADLLTAVNFKEIIDDTTENLTLIDTNTEFATPEVYQYQLYLRMMATQYKLKYCGVKANAQSLIGWSYKRQSRTEGKEALKPDVSKILKTGLMPFKFEESEEAEGKE